MYEAWVQAAPAAHPTEPEVVQLYDLVNWDHWGAGTSQHGLSPKTMALITSDCGAIRSLGTKWPQSPRVVCSSGHSERAGGELRGAKKTKAAAGNNKVGDP